MPPPASAGDRMRALAQRQIHEQTREPAWRKAPQRDAEPRLAIAARTEPWIVVRELHLTHLDADPLTVEVPHRARQPNDHRRRRLADHAIAAHLQLEPALRLDQILGHARRQPG